MRFNEQGRSMIEMLGVLAIVGVLSVGGIAGYSKAMNKFKTNKLIEQVNMISTNIRTLYSSQKSYEGLGNGAAIRTGVLPNEMYGDASNVSATDSSATITNAFAGSVKIQPGGVKDDADNGAFVISMDKIPEAACVSIATTEWGGDAGGGLLAIEIVGGTAGVDAASATATDIALVEPDGDNVYLIENGDLPVSVVNAASACEGAENTIAWKYM